MTHNPDSSNNKGEVNKQGERTRKEGFERRDFLKLSATGVIASLAAGCSARMVAPSVSADASQSSAETGTEVPEPGVPKVPERLPDPESLSAGTWQEPWTWRPQQWPDRQLQLNVTRGQNPGFSPSPASFGSLLFSFGGISPGPTIRVRNEDRLKLTVRNLLEMNHGLVEVGPFPNLFDIPPNLVQEICTLVEEQTGFTNPEEPGDCPVQDFPEQAHQVTGVELRPNWHIGGHINKFHAAHTTNIHTHGLHVQPQVNANGSHSDDIFLRILPQGDYEKRKAELGDSEDLLKPHEHVGELDYEFHLAFERDGKPMPHPPGTHWYHPHSHGATHIQVSSGMAGFLLVEGDVDQAINRAMTGEDWPDPEMPTGDWDYRERLMLLQRVFIQSFDTDAPPQKRHLRFPPFPAVNGTKDPAVFKLRPGAVERWRVLNGSVDGAGTKRLMVLEGQYTVRREGIFRVVSETIGEGEEAERKRELVPVTPQELDAAKLDLQQLAFDGITLVRERNGKAEHYIRDLSKVNAGTEHPLNAMPRMGESPTQAMLRGYEDCFRDGALLDRAFNRPNEVIMANANRTDLFFKVPLDAAGKVFTVFASESRLHSDSHHSNLQLINASPEEPPIRRPGFDVAVSYIHVDGEPVGGGDFDIQSLNAHLPPVPPLLQPVTEEELVVGHQEAARTGVEPGSRRTRTLAYTGTGATDFPVTYCPPGYTKKHADMVRRLWMEWDGVEIILPQASGTMGIHPDFDLRFNPEPEPSRKFVAFDKKAPRMLLDTAEEWVVYNTSQTLWSHTDLERFPQPGAEPPFRYRSYPVRMAEGQRRFSEDPEFKITTKGNDHPFHIHINPMWVLRVDVPDENGVLHNVLPAPCWMDTAAIPRNGGRIVFRSRFEDFTGHWINHCHILAHEDNGMMQMIECVDDPARANYRPRERAASASMSGPAVDAIYPRPSLELMYRQNLSFVDPSHIGGYEFPGFEIDVPRLDDD